MYILICYTRNKRLKRLKIMYNLNYQPLHEIRVIDANTHVGPLQNHYSTIVTSYLKPYSKCSQSIESDSMFHNIRASS